jgi:hypothetical protein
VGARAIAGDVVPHNAFIWTRKDGFTDLGVMDGPNSDATDVTEAGAVVGWIGGASYTVGTRSFIWENGVARDIGVPDGSLNIVALAASFTNVIAGKMYVPASTPPGFTNHAFYLGNEGVTDLGVLPGFNLSFAQDINDADVVVGFLRLLGQNFDRPLIWRDGVMQELNSLLVPGTGVILGEAGRIDNAGVILAYTVSHQTAILTPMKPAFADMTGDCTVDIRDLLRLLSLWNTPHTIADLIGDGTVNASDLSLLITAWA